MAAVSYFSVQYAEVENFLYESNGAAVLYVSSERKFLEVSVFGHSGPQIAPSLFSADGRGIAFH